MITETNKKILVEKAGGPDQLQFIDAPMPSCGPDEVLIRNEAVGVAFADILVREGVYPGASLPATPGYEVVGVIIAKGGLVSSVQLGQRVAALTVHRGYCRFICVPAADAVTVPESLSSPQAASLVLNGLTAFQMLTRCVAIQSTPRILIWGAAGGVGSILLDLARHYRITAFGVASASRLSFVASKGGIPLDRTKGNVAESLKKLAPSGVSAVFDGVGGANIKTSQKLLAVGGTVVMFGVQEAFKNGRKNVLQFVKSYLSSPRMTAHQIFLSNHGLKGYLIDSWKETYPDWYKKDLAEVFDLADKGAISPVIDEVIPLSKAQEAHRRFSNDSPIGKIVLDPFA